MAIYAFIFFPLVLPSWVIPIFFLYLLVISSFEQWTSDFLLLYVRVILKHLKMEAQVADVETLL